MSSAADHIATAWNIRLPHEIANAIAAFQKASGDVAELRHPISLTRHDDLMQRRADAKRALCEAIARYIPAECAPGTVEAD